MKSRVKYVDTMRELVILTVVVGHLVQRNIAEAFLIPCLT